MAEDKKEYNNQEFLEQLRAINDEDKISMDELNVLDVGNCPICYEKLQFLKYDEKEKKLKPNPNVVTTPCGHSFCFTCLAKHLALKHKCPMCRAKIINRNQYRLLSTQEGCFVINQKVDMHLTYKFDSLFTAADNMQDPSILLSNVKYCMYDIMQAFRRLQVVDDSDEEDT
jgi:hypothetical protein